MEEYLDPFTGEEIKKTKNSTPLGWESSAVGDLSRPLGPVRKAYSRRTNHPFTRVVLIKIKPNN